MARIAAPPSCNAICALAATARKPTRHGARVPASPCSRAARRGGASRTRLHVQPLPAGSRAAGCPPRRGSRGRATSRAGSTPAQSRFRRSTSSNLLLRPLCKPNDGGPAVTRHRGQPPFAHPASETQGIPGSCNALTPEERTSDGGCREVRDSATSPIPPGGPGRSSAGTQRTPPAARATRRTLPARSGRCSRRTAGGSRRSRP
jgi:hypothetical protein